MLTLSSQFRLDWIISPALPPALLPRLSQAPPRGTGCENADSLLLPQTDRFRDRSLGLGFKVSGAGRNDLPGTTSLEELKRHGVRNRAASLLPPQTDRFGVQSLGLGSGACDAVRPLLPPHPATLVASHRAQSQPRLHLNTPPLT
eukprot:699965-Rhodomonas_salina.1